MGNSLFNLPIMQKEYYRFSILYPGAGILTHNLISWVSSHKHQTRAPLL